MTPKQKTYTIEISHSAIHALTAAIGLAFAVQESDLDSADKDSKLFDSFTGTPARKLAAVRARRALLAAHQDAVRDDGHGDEFDREPLQGTDLADAMSEFDAALASIDRALAGEELDPDGGPQWVG